MKIGSVTRLPGERFELGSIDPGDTGGLKSKKAARSETAENLERLRELQERLYAAEDQALLIVMQAMDTAGKDGTIKHVCGAFNPQGVAVSSFKAPSKEDLAHDFLWRIHHKTPKLSMVGIFNRSHYEDVLVVRVKNYVPESIWRPRFEHINNFESLLAANRVKIVKIYLHISPDEQAERLRERQVTPEKHWKFNPGDLEDRKLWWKFQEAYEDALSLCNTEVAPWHVVPANRKWYRNLVVSRVLIKTLEEMDLRFPKPVADLDSYTIPEI